MTTATPSLHNGPTDMLTNKQKKLWNLIAFFFQNPGSISNIVEHELISFRKLDAEFGTDRERMAAETRAALQQPISRLFEDEDIDVNVTIDEKDDVYYTLNIAILSNNDLMLSAPFPVENGKVNVRDWSRFI